jgi:beta-glucosidase
MAGDEVLQAYLKAPDNKPSGAQFAPITLAAFDRISLQPGEEREVTLHIERRAFEYWSTDKKAWVKPAGPRTVMVGSSSRQLPLTTHVE